MPDGDGRGLLGTNRKIASGAGRALIGAVSRISPIATSATVAASSRYQAGASGLPEMCSSQVTTSCAVPPKVAIATRIDGREHAAADVLRQALGEGGIEGRVRYRADQRQQAETGDQRHAHRGHQRSTGTRDRSATASPAGARPSPACGHSDPPASRPPSAPMICNPLPTIDVVNAERRRHMQRVLRIGRHVLRDIGRDRPAGEHHDRQRDDARVPARQREVT